MPVGSMTWGRSRRAGYVSGSGWSCTNAQQSSTKYTLASGNGDFPVWQYNISELVWTSM